MVKLGANPSIHIVALLASGGELQHLVVRKRLSEILIVTGDALRR
jgi:hypothetical protein